MSNIGQNLTTYLSAGIKDRYFYGLRRTVEGELYMHKIDQMKAGESVSINVPDCWSKSNFCAGVNGEAKLTLV